MRALVNHQGTIMVERRAGQFFVKTPGGGIISITTTRPQAEASARAWAQAHALSGAINIIKVAWRF